MKKKLPEVILMYRFCVALFAEIFLVASPAFAAGPLPFEELLYAGRAVSFYGNPANETQSQLVDILKSSRMSERMAELTNGSLRLRKNLSIGFESCGQPNAFYNPRQIDIVFCFEMLELIIKQAQSDKDYAMKMDRANFSTLMDGVVWGIFLHELGHAVIDINRIPITGREEDVADQFALYFSIKFLEPYNVSVVAPTAWFFKSLAKSKNIELATQDAVKRLMADEHSLDDQRTYNLACWAFGADPVRGISAVKFVALPEERAKRCSVEYSRLDNGIKSRFGKYFLIKSK